MMQNEIQYTTPYPDIPVWGLFQIGLSLLGKITTDFDWHNLVENFEQKYAS